METYYIDGYRIAARSYSQALETARQLKQRGAPKGSWPGESKPTLTVSERTALEQILDFLRREEGRSHHGYYSFGFAGQQLQKVLERQ